MGLIVLTVILAMVGGCLTWLVVGDQFPRGESVKWPATNNILVYSAALVVPIYGLIFTISSLLQD